MRLRPTFIPDSDKLIFSDRRNIYTLTTSSEVELQDFTFQGNIDTPAFHPNGNRLLLVTGHYDSDIARVSLNTIQTIKNSQPSENKASSPFTPFKRSTAHDDKAKFQPNGNQIAFISARTGSEQLWLGSENSQPKMLSNLPEGSYVENIQWNRSGTAVCVLANRELYQVSVDGAQNSDRQRKYQANYPIEKLFHWDDENQTAIANIQVNGRIKFVEIDLTSKLYTALTNTRNLGLII